MLEIHYSIEIELAYMHNEAVGPHLHSISLQLYSLKACKEKLLLLCLEAVHPQGCS